MRVGKFLEHMQAALKATAIQDPFVSYTAVGRQLGYMCYLVLDTLQWVSSQLGFEGRDGGRASGMNSGCWKSRAIFLAR